MRKVAKRAAFEVLTGGKAWRAADAARLVRPKDLAPGQPISLPVTPLGAFAAAAVAVSALALAFSLGRHYAAAQPVDRPAAGSLDEVQRQTPIDYNDLQIDRGQAS